MLSSVWRCITDRPPWRSPLIRLTKCVSRFTIRGKPVPPEIFTDFGDAMMSDSRPIVVPIDANAAIHSNRYADPIKTNGRWVEEMKAGLGSFNGPETMSYEYRGATANGLLFFVAAYSGGGSGTFYYLHILDAASAGALDEDGSTYSRLNLTLVRTYVLGDRWKGDVSIPVIPFASSPTQASVATALASDDRSAKALRRAGRK